MIGVTLSTQNIRGAPPTVRRWLEDRVLSLLGEVSSAEPAIPTELPSVVAFDDVPGGSSAASSGDVVNIGEQTQVSDQSSYPTDAGRHPAIQKLIAERAYELWENEGRPSGRDLIHWQDAERDIMKHLKHLHRSQHDRG